MGALGNPFERAQTHNWMCQRRFDYGRRQLLRKMALAAAQHEKDEDEMKLTSGESVCGGMRRMGSWIALAVVTVLSAAASAQAVSTTTVQGTVYLANGQPGGGTVVVSWPAFTTAAGQAIAADRMTVTIPADGFVSVNLAPNQGATPAGEYYTAVYYMSDGSRAPSTGWCRLRRRRRLAKCAPRLCRRHRHCRR